MTLGMRLRSSVMAAVYNKSLILSSGAKQNTTTGEMVNLMAVDAQVPTTLIGAKDFTQGMFVRISFAAALHGSDVVSSPDLVGANANRAIAVLSVGPDGLCGARR
jgi:hypothetical protein